MGLSTSSLRPVQQASDTKGILSGLGRLLTIAVWFGIVLGLTEGIGLLAFQRINWQRWGAMTHVSKEIVWISPIVDVLIFLGVSAIAALGCLVWRRLSAITAAVFVFAFLTIYDWTTLTERLYHVACLLLAFGVAVAAARWFQRHQLAAIRFWKKSVIWVGLLWLIVFSGIRFADWYSEHSELAALPPPTSGAPNIVLIVVDTLRADHLSTYGYSRATTPHLDRMAKEGVLFENAISACSWTLPSHASLLTGRYPADHGMQDAQPMPWLGWGRNALHGYPTLGEALEHLGYRTGAFSANQTYFTSNVGLGRGFSHFEDYFQSADDMFLRTLYGREFSRAYLHRSNKSAWTRGLRAVGLGGLLDNRKHADEVNREALAWIDRGNRPFFVFLNYIEVHDASALGWTNASPAWGRATTIDRYDSALTYVDGEIAVLMQALDRRGFSKNTLVIVTGDHGESLGQHHMQYHGIALYREDLQVPLIWWYRGHLPAGVRVHVPVSNADIAPTIMQIAGEKPGKQVFPGHAFSALWNHQAVSDSWPYPVSQLEKNEIVIDPDRQARRFIPTAMDGDMQSMVTPQWHLILHQTLGAQLYDWVNDPGELHNLIDTPEGSAEAQKLESEMKADKVP